MFTQPGSSPPPPPNGFLARTILWLEEARLAIAKAAENETATQTSAQTVKTPEEVRILLLEDNEMNAIVLEGYLEILGFPPPKTVSNLEDFESFRDDIHAGHYDIVIMDIMLPDGESTPVAKSLSTSCDTPLLAYTAHSSGSHCEKLTSAGFHAILEKPLSLVDLKRDLQGLSGLRT